MRLDRDLGPPFDALGGRTRRPRGRSCMTQWRSNGEQLRGRQVMRRRARYATSALAALSILLMLVTGIGSAAAQGKPIRIGEINSYSGLATVYTFPYKEGLLMAAKEINDAGGVLGARSSSSSATTSSSPTRR